MKPFLLLIATLHHPFCTEGQELLFADGLRLEAAFQVAEALLKFEEVIRLQPTHVKALTKASRMASFLAERLPANARTEKLKLIAKSKYYAERALQITPDDLEARLAFMISLGLLSETTGNPFEKVKSAKIIYEEATKALTINPTFAPAQFILGKWQLELSQLNRIELAACKMVWGGLPEEISKEAALQYFTEAVKNQHTSLLFLYGLSQARIATGEGKLAKESLTKALALPETEPNDYLYKQQCEQLQKKINR
jgi:tetratricopeptide (TPR) repeat protein